MHGGVAGSTTAAHECLHPQAARLRVVGSESLRPDGYWTRLESNVELSEQEWSEVKAHLHDVLRSALRKNSGKIGFFLDETTTSST